VESAVVLAGRNDWKITYSTLKLPCEQCIESNPCVLKLDVGVLKQHTFEKSVTFGVRQQCVLRQRVNEHSGFLIASKNNAGHGLF
jgi:hypothetical protein